MKVFQKVSNEEKYLQLFANFININYTIEMFLKEKKLLNVKKETAEYFLIKFKLNFNCIKWGLSVCSLLGEV